MSTVADSWDDDELLAALRQAVRARQAVPAEFVEVGKNAFAWHNIDAELAQLTYDSSRDFDHAQSVRAEAPSIRALTFTSTHLTIELELAQDSLLGQIVPPQAGTIEVQLGAGAGTALTVNEIGCFSIHPVPHGPFRLHCRTASGVDVLTGWLTLLGR